MLLLGVPAQADDGVSRALLDIHERLYLERDGAGIFPGTTIHEPVLVGEFYESREFRPAWTDADYAREMLQVLKTSVEEGLAPADYHYQELLSLQEQYQQGWSDNIGKRPLPWRSLPASKPGSMSAVGIIPIGLFPGQGGKGESFGSGVFYNGIHCNKLDFCRSMVLMTY